MLKVWRGNNKLFAECTECGSYGTAPHLQPKLKMSPEIEAAVERHTAHMMALRASYTKATTAIAVQIKNGSMTRAEGSSQIRKLWDNHVAQVRLGEAGLPDPTGQTSEFVTACPWCAKPEEIEIETLPAGQLEPDFALAVPVRKFIAANMKKGS